MIWRRRKKGSLLQAERDMWRAAYQEVLPALEAVLDETKRHRSNMTPWERLTVEVASRTLEAQSNPRALVPSDEQR